MKKDDWKFLTSLIAVIALAAVVVYNAHHSRLAVSAGSTVDLERIERLVEEGLLSLEEASFWEPVEDPR